MKNIKNYLITTGMLLISLNPFSSYAHSVPKYSPRQLPIMEQEEIFDYNELQNQIIINIPMPLDIPVKLYHSKKSPFPPAPIKGNLERIVKPVKEVKLEFP